MARKITDAAVKAFFDPSADPKGFQCDNTSVTHYALLDKLTTLGLHGNTIATRDRVTGEVRISLAGWPTRTTRERLNGLLDYLGQPRLYQRRGEQFMGDKPFPSHGFVTVREASRT